MGTDWKTAEDAEGVYEGRDRATGALQWTGTASTWCSARTPSCARSSEVYASDDAQQKFVHDFVAAWSKVMNLDRFDLA